ncbi:MAG: type IV pilus modification protein PilV [Candidatus Sedimenticola sp. (ex Thyasira tokunagai)]
MTLLQSISQTNNKQQGATLLEVIVSFMLLAIGLLGVTALQISGSQFSHDAYLRSQISISMNDMVDRMRINRSNAATYVTTSIALTGTAPVCNPGGKPDATNDISCWQRHLMVNKILPPGTTTSITRSGNEYVIAVNWTDRQETAHNISYRFEP